MGPLSGSSSYNNTLLTHLNELSLLESEVTTPGADLNLQDPARFNAVSQDSNPLANDIALSKKGLIYRDFALGKAVWEGVGVRCKETLEQEIKSLPINIEEILAAPCSAFSEKTIGETHVLIRIPEGLTINKLQEVAKRLFSNKPDGFNYIWYPILDELGDKPQEKSEWVLMTKDVVPGTRNISFGQQLDRIKELAEDSKALYEPPRILTVMACMIAKYIGSGEAKTRLFNDAPWTHTRTLDQVQGDFVIVGGFSPSGFEVCDNHINSEHFGLAALRKL